MRRLKCGIYSSLPNYSQEFYFETQRKQKMESVCVCSDGSGKNNWLPGRRIISGAVNFSSDGELFKMD